MEPFGINHLEGIDIDDNSWTLSLKDKIFEILVIIVVLLFVINIIMMVWRYGCCGCGKGDRYKYKMVEFADSEFISECEIDSNTEIVPIKQ